MKAYSNVGSTKPKKTPVVVSSQSEPVANKKMIRTDGGGYGFKVDDMKRLERFLILGSEGGTYYVDSKKLTFDNYQTLVRCLDNNWAETIRLIVDVSTKGRAAKNDPAIFALAIAASHKYGGDEFQRRAAVRYAMQVLPEVCRIGTHLFHFVSYMHEHRGWGVAIRRGIRNWYLQRNVQQLAFQMAKYQSRDGWSHRDIIRLGHISPNSLASDGVDSETIKQYNNLFKWAIGKEYSDDLLCGLVDCLERMKDAKTASEVIALIEQYRAPREVIPTEFMKNPDVWRAMLPHMGMEAMIRNLGNMSSYGVFADKTYTKMVCDQLNDPERIRKERLHPIKALTALRTYEVGRGIKGDNTWTVNRDIAYSLENAFYHGFAAVEPTGKNIMYGLDISGSMAGGATWTPAGVVPFMGVPNFSPREATAALSLVLANTEKKYDIYGFSHYLIDLKSKLQPGMKLKQATDNIDHLPFGSTNPGLLIEQAIKTRSMKYDAFVVMTDNDINTGDHPFQLLNKYRSQVNDPNVKMVIIAMTATGSTIADPSDFNSLECVGFDANLPEFVSNFIRG